MLRHTGSHWDYLNIFLSMCSDGGKGGEDGAGTRHLAVWPAVGWGSCSACLASQFSDSDTSSGALLPPYSPVPQQVPRRAGVSALTPITNQGYQNFLEYPSTYSTSGSPSLETRMMLGPLRHPISIVYRRQVRSPDRCLIKPRRQLWMLHSTRGIIKERTASPKLAIPHRGHAVCSRD
jgi:hypothetical protein